MDYPISPYAPDNAPEGLWAYDERRARKVTTFIETFCRFPEGLKAGQPFKMLDWQKEEIIKPLFGTIRYSEEQGKHVRQFRRAWIEVARKNGKSTFMAAVALYLTGFDGELGAQVYSVAGSIKQAAQVFKAAANMVNMSPELKKQFRVLDATKTIIHTPTNSRYAVLSSDANDALGTNPSAVIFDEVVAQKNRDLWDSMMTGMGARSQPLFLAITTAGYTTAKFCLEEHTYSEKVAADPTIDPSRFVFMRNTPMDADWEDESNWHYANPSLGSALSIETMREMAQAARKQPQSQNSFRAFILNQWVTQEKRWIDMGVWDQSGKAGGNVVEEALHGRKCYGGLDLSSKQDMTGWVLLFPGSPTDENAPGFTLLIRAWMPEDALNRRDKMVHDLNLWKNEGWLRVTDGGGVNLEAIQDQIMRDAEKFNIVRIGNDPWNAQQLVQNLEENAGLQIVVVNQNNARLNEPTMEIERLVYAHQIYHGYNPVLRWNMENVALSNPDFNGNVRPSKKNSAEKIDCVAAMINAVAMALIPEEEQGTTSFYSFFDD